MTYKTIHFDDGRPNFQGNMDPEPCPRVRIDVLPPAGSSAHPWRGMGLIDTGASSLFLPAQIAQRLGIPLAGPDVTRMKVWTANGLAYMDQRKIDVKIHGVLVPDIYALFLSNQRVLVGRSVLFKFLQAIGFEQDQWLLKYATSQPETSVLPVPHAVSKPVDLPAIIQDFETHVQIGSVSIDKRRG